MRKWTLLLGLFGALFLMVHPLQAAVLSPGETQETDPFIRYSGTWTIAACSGARGGGCAYAQKPASLEFDFYGTSFALYYPKAQTGSSARIHVDGVHVATIDQNTGGSATSTYGHYFVVDNLTLGIHTVWMGFEFLQPGNNVIMLDSIYIPTPPPPPTPTPGTPAPIVVTFVMPTQAEATPDPWFVLDDIDDGTGTLQTVAFEYRIDAGTVVVVLLLAAIFFLQLFMAAGRFRRNG